ncbi:MAG: peptidoglycan DD-metalloendopeptidase family protein [Cyanobacteria bacterium]|nr:peptidoglycan DD-metalloendopeptidase family protein [Cyanobacteria bacterium GSL.Bin21]
MRYFIAQLGYDPSRTWQGGDAVASFLMLGDIQEAFRLEEFSLQNIAERTGLAMANVALSEFGVMEKQTLKTLVEAIPDLADLAVKDMPPIKALVETALGISDNASVLNQSLGELLESYSQLDNLYFEAIDLGQYPLSSIPGLIQTPLKTFAQWQERFIEEIPGLQQVPFAQFPQALDTGLTLVGKVDVVWGAAEHGHPEVGADYYVSGSGKEGGLTQPVPCNSGELCAYLELTDFFGLDAETVGLGGVKGKRWASGATQQVEGGFGVLGKVNGGKEPAGRLVYGSPFKVAVTETHEPEGQAQRGLYFRVCIRGLVDLGCTPYFIGPVPWFPVQEKGMIILAGADAPPVEIPESYQNQIDQILSQYQPQPASDRIRVDGPCTEQLVQAAPDGMESAAARSLPLILAEAEQAGLTPAQTAYVLATVERESNMGHLMEELGGQNKPYAPYYGRGYVQITHKENYIYWSNRLGVDLVNNRELATEPEIAAKILVQGMQEGTYTGVTSSGTLIPGGGYKLSDFINDNEIDFYNARRIVNGTDHASEIANNAQDYYDVLKGCQTRSGTATGQFSHPAPGYAVTSEFGPRRSPCAGCSSFHKGIDLATPTGTNIAAVDGGKVIYAQYSDGYGYTVFIEHGNGVQTRYSHLSQIGVQVGDPVTKGDIIAQSGSSGLGTGPHLDFGVYTDTQSGAAYTGTARNPREFIDF